MSFACLGKIGSTRGCKMLSLAIITTLTFAQPPKPPAVPPVRCALKVKKMFHDEHNQPSSPITFGVYEIKDAKDGSGYSITSLNGSGWTTTATRDAKTGFLTVTLPGVKKTYSGRADGAPKEPCEFFNWYDSKTPQGMPALEWGPGPLPPPAAPCAFKNEVWHSEPMSPEQEAEGFVFNSLNTTHFTIHSMNNTFDDTVAIIVNVQSGDDRPVSAVFSNENPRKAVSQGIMRGTVCENLAWSIISGNATNMDYWNKGM